MFLVFARSSKFKVLAVIFLLLTACCSIFIVKNIKNTSTAVSKNCGKYKILAADNESRIKFLEQFNLKVEPEPIEEIEISIPYQFNKVYEKYNDIQKENGLDLEKYKGKICTKYTYKVLNYKNAKSEVRANLLIFDGKVIAGDICSLELDGFMHGFTKNEENDKSNVTYNMNKTSAVNSNI